MDETTNVIIFPRIFKRACQDHMGHTYKNFKELCREYGLPPEKVRYEMSKGDPMWFILNGPGLNNSFGNLHVALQNGICEQRFFKRRALGWNVNSAATVPPGLEDVWEMEPAYIGLRDRIYYWVDGHGINGVGRTKEPLSPEEFIELIQLSGLNLHRDPPSTNLPPEFLERNTQVY